MKLTNLRVMLIAALLLLAGWTAGKAQTTAPDFEIVVTTTSTGTAVRCVRGCNLSWAERGLNPQAKAISQFEYSCQGGSSCSSGTISGWLQK
jgi:hypothetical protein